MQNNTDNGAHSFTEAAQYNEVSVTSKQLNKITPEQFIKNCSWNELQELNKLINPEIRKRFDQVPFCRVCGCTDDDCRQCIEKTGQPCSWAEPDLCSACADVKQINIDDKNSES